MADQPSHRQPVVRCECGFVGTDVSDVEDHISRLGYPGHSVQMGESPTVKFGASEATGAPLESGFRLQKPAPGA